MNAIAASSATQQHSMLQTAQIMVASKSPQSTRSVAQQALTLITSAMVPPPPATHGHHVDAYA